MLAACKNDNDRFSIVAPKFIMSGSAQTRSRAECRVVSMPTPEQLICPQCQGKLAKIFVGKRPRKRTFVCTKCDSIPNPLKVPEVQGWLNSGLKPPE